MSIVEKKRIPFESLGRDLFCRVRCNCPDPRFADSSVAHLFTRDLKLTGYADDYFFRVVNAAPRETKCACGRVLRYQWFTDGVEAEWCDEQEGVA